MYEVRKAGAKGLGLFAKVPISRGSRILSEQPTLAIRQDQNAADIYTASRLLSTVDRLKVLQLSYHITSPLLRWSQVAGYTAKQLFSDVTKNTGSAFMPSLRTLKEHMTILSIFRTNAFSVGGTSNIHQAVFAGVARLNHSCVPNSQGNFHEGLGCFNVYATRDIKAEEELTISYLPEHGAAQATRQKSLVDGYGFSCECPACDLSTERGQGGESRRLAMQDELEKFAERATESESRNVGAELETIRSYIQLYEMEGIAGRELSTMYFEAAKLNEELGKVSEALECAESGLQIEEDCLGADHPLYEHGLVIVQRLRGISRIGVAVAEERKLHISK